MSFYYLLSPLIKPNRFVFAGITFGLSDAPQAIIYTAQTTTGGRALSGFDFLEKKIRCAVPFCIIIVQTQSRRGSLPCIVQHKS